MSDVPRYVTLKAVSQSGLPHEILEILERDLNAQIHKLMPEIMHAIMCYGTACFKVVEGRITVVPPQDLARFRGLMRERP